MPRTQQSSETASAAATSTSSGGAAGPAASSSVTPQSPVSSGNYAFSLLFFFVFVLMKDNRTKPVDTFTKLEIEPKNTDWNLLWLWCL